MGVTAIRDVRNHCSAPATVRNTQSGVEGIIAPGAWRELTMPIPWCLPGDDFRVRHIDVLVGGRLFTIWQADRSGADLAMPGTNGFWFREQQLREPALAHVPVIVFTGAANGEQLHRLAVADVLLKPFSVDDLCEAIDRHCATA